MKKLFLLIFVLFLIKHSAGQCCSAGNPFFYGEISNLNTRNLQFVAGYKYSTSNSYYEGSKPTEIDFIDRAYTNYLTIQAYYGLSKRITIDANLGYFINKTEVYLKEDWNTSNGYGLGDATLGIKYLAYKNEKRKLRIVPALGITLPVGVFDQEKDNVKLPITVQPSSGSFKYQASVYINKSSKNGRLTYIVYAMFEYAQLINSDNFYYKYGNQYLFSVLTSYKISGKFSGAMEMRSENRGRSLRNDNQIVSSSGYNIVYMIPHLSYSPNKKLSIALNSDVPVYKYYNGLQLSNSFSISLRLSYRVDLHK